MCNYGTSVAFWLGLRFSKLVSVSDFWLAEKSKNGKYVVLESQEMLKPYTSLGRNLGLCTWQTFCCTITCWISLPLQDLKLGGTEKVLHIQHSPVQVPKLIFQPVWPGWNYQSSLWHLCSCTHKNSWFPIFIRNWE